MSTLLPLTFVLLSAGASEQATAAFPGQNDKIAFASDRDGDFDIYTMNPDGSGVKRLTNNSAADSQPAFSPDGKRIAFASNRDGNLEIYTMNADNGSNVIRITNNPSDDFTPAFAPDGKRIAFVSDRGFGDSDIYLFVDATKPPVLLTRDIPPNPPSDSHPAFAPIPEVGDDATLVFESTRFGGFRIFKMHILPDGQHFVGAVSNLQEDFQPNYSPNGSLIVFMSQRANAQGLNNQSIFTMKENGGSQTRLTNREGQPPTGDKQPAFSPAGNKIVFVSGRNGGNEIFSMNPDGSGVKRLTNHPASDLDPDWGPKPT